MAQILLVKTAPNILTPATPEAREFVQRLKPAIWLKCDVKQARNYLFHKKYFSLLKLGFEYWTPTGGAIAEAERQYLAGYIRYLTILAGSGEILQETEKAYNEQQGLYRVRDVALVKSFEAFRRWATIQAGFYDEFILPDNTRRREACSIAFANMREAEFQEVYKATLNVLWNYILFRAFRSQQEADNAASQLMGYAA